jgi:hypothetical protein
MNQNNFNNGNNNFNNNMNQNNFNNGNGMNNMNPNFFNNSNGANNINPNFFNNNNGMNNNYPNPFNNDNRMNNNINNMNNFNYPNNNPNFPNNSNIPPNNPNFPNNQNIPPNNPNFPNNQNIPPNNPNIPQNNQNYRFIHHENCQKLEQILPKLDHELYLDETQKTQYIAIQKTYNIVFNSNTGLKLNIKISAYMKMADLFKLFVNRLGVSEKYIGKEICFLLGGKLMDPFSEKLAETELQDGMMITVFDQNGVIGA